MIKIMKNSDHAGVLACQNSWVTVGVLLVISIGPVFGAGRGIDLDDAASNEGVSNFTGALQLDSKSFKLALRGSTAPHVLMEFYASWCPACQKFKPHYDRVARVFHLAASDSGPFVLVAGVDCAKEMQLCQDFAIDRYPTMLWGSRRAFARGRRAEKKKAAPASDPLEVVDAAKKDRDVLLWVNKKTGLSFSLAEEDTDRNRAAVQAAMEEAPEEDLPEGVPMWDVEEATALGFQYMLGSVTEENAAEKRPKVVPFIQLVAMHHPSPRCRLGSSQLLATMDELWPPEMEDDTEGGGAGGEGALPERTVNVAAVQGMKVCGAALPRGSWRWCQGSKPGLRGYSCGLWMTFHSLAARLSQQEGSLLLAAMRGFIDASFRCEECRKHFLDMSESPEAKAVATRRDAVLWLWRTHNKVNERLSQEEVDEARGDPFHPKRQFPSAKACRRCQPLQSGGPAGNEHDVEWDESAVYRFLLTYYGQPHYDSDIALTTADRAVALGTHLLMTGSDAASELGTGAGIPAGAALGLTVAVCGFAVVAFFWRMTQKRRKAW